MLRRAAIRLLFGIPLLPGLKWTEKYIPIHLRGIPYHQTDASTSSWLGIERK